jgi:hypothetical protein
MGRAETLMIAEEHQPGRKGKPFSRLLVITVA